jgi:diaminopimelate decarboxylase
MSVSRRGRWTILEGLRKDWKEETTSLARASLSASHQIAASHNNGNRVFLDRCGGSVSRKLDVAQEMIIEGRVCEGGDCFGNICTRSLNGDIIVIGEVDSSGLF